MGPIGLGNRFQPTVVFHFRWENGVFLMAHFMEPHQPHPVKALPPWPKTSRGYDILEVIGQGSAGRSESPARFSGRCGYF